MNQQKRIRFQFLTIAFFVFTIQQMRGGVSPLTIQLDLNNPTLVQPFFSSLDDLNKKCVEGSVLSVQLKKSRDIHNSKWKIALGAFDTISISSYAEGKYLETREGGWNYPLRVHDGFIEGGSATHFFYLHPQADSLYIRFSTPTPYKRVIPQLFTSNNTFQINTNQWLFFGFIIIVLILSTYIVLLYVASGEKGYIFYLLSNIVFVIIWLISYGYFLKWFWGSSPSLDYKITVVAVFLHTFSFLLFLRYHLDVAQHSPRVKKYLNYFLQAYFVTLAIFIWTSYALTVVFLFSIFVLPFIITLLVVGYRIHKRAVVFIIVATSFLMLGNVITILAEIQVLPFNAFTSNAIIIGVILEVITQSIGLGYYFKKVKKELLITHNKLSTLEQNADKKEDKKEQVLTLSSGKKQLEVSRNEICWIEAADNYCFIQLDDNSYFVRTTLKALYEKFGEGENIIQVHRSFIVSIKKITAIHTNYFFIGNKKIPISRTFKKNIPKKLFDKK